MKPAASAIPCAGRGEPFLILEIQQDFTGLQHVLLGEGYLFVEKIHLCPGQGMAHLVHEAFALFYQHCRNRLGRGRVIGLRSDTQDARVIVKRHFHAREIVAVEPLDGGEAKSRRESL